MGIFKQISVFIFLFFLLLLSSQEASYAAGICDITGFDVSPEEQALFSRVNEWRMENKNAPSMQLSVPLNKAASWMAREVDNRTNVGHADYLGRNYPQRIIDCGFPSGTASGESIKVNASADGAFDWWVTYTENGMHAPTSFKCGGIGHYGNSWTAVYSTAVNGVCPDVSDIPEVTTVPSITQVNPSPGNSGCDPYSEGNSKGKITSQDLVLVRQEVAKIVNTNKGSCIFSPSTNATNAQELVKIRRVVAELESL